MRPAQPDESTQLMHWFPDYGLYSTCAHQQIPMHHDVCNALGMLEAPHDNCDIAGPSTVILFSIQAALRADLRPERVPTLDGRIQSHGHLASQARPQSSMTTSPQQHAKSHEAKQRS